MNYPIPDAALDSHVGILGKVGSGKSYTARGLAERLLHLRRQVVIIDPTGAWYGLRTGFEIPIFGGRHADVEIGDLAGEAVASVIVEKTASAIIDLSLMTAGGQRRFMRDFAHRLRAKPPGALYLFLDEADEFLPQEKIKAGRGSEANTDANLFGDLKWMVRRGRLNGFRVTMITQRPAEIAKAVLTQIETLVAHRLTAPQDRKAIEEWVKGHADPEAHKDVLRSLASLEQGVAWVWAPDLDILVKEKMPAIETFDSSRTPEPGEVEIVPPKLADLDLSAIKERLASVEEEAKANDPRALKAEVARLTKALNSALENLKGRGPAPEWPDQREQVAALVAELEQCRVAMERLTAGAKELQARQKKALAALTGEVVAIPETPAPRPVVRAPAPAPARVQRLQIAASSEGANLKPMDGVTGPQRRLLNALAWWRAFGIEQPRSEQVAFMAGYSASSSGYANLKGAMRSAGLIDYPLPGCISLLPAGAEHAEAPTGAINSETFLDRVRAKLAGAQLRLLNPLIEVYPESLPSDALAEAAGYSSSSSGYANLKGNMRTLGFIDYPQPGFVRAEDWLFP